MHNLKKTTFTEFNVSHDIFPINLDNKLDNLLIPKTMSVGLNQEEKLLKLIFIRKLFNKKVYILNHKDFNNNLQLDYEMNSRKINFKKNTLFIIPEVYTKDNSEPVDFCVVYNNKILPIEYKPLSKVSLKRNNKQINRYYKNLLNNKIFKGFAILKPILVGEDSRDHLISEDFFINNIKSYLR